MSTASRPRVRDVSTVVSILPFSINESKPGLIPGEFKMDKVKAGDFQLLVIERCQHAVYLDESRPRLIVPDPSDTVAASIVNDFKYSNHGFVSGVAEPGLSWVYGEFPNTPEGKALFKAQHAAVLLEMERLQMKWFETLVFAADDDWAKYRRHSLITPTQRYAAMSMGLTSKEWLIEQEIKEAQSRCKFCFTMVDPRAVVCAGCHGDLTKEKYSNVTSPAAQTVTK